MVHHYYELMAHDATYYECAIDEDVQLDFEGISGATAEANMITLDTESIKQHVNGMAMVGTFWSSHHVQRTEVVSYAGLTGFEIHDGQKLAVVGGIITLPELRNKGFAEQTVGGLLETASRPEAVEEHGHQGFLARCNKDSKLLVDKLGFTEVGEELGKLVMIKTF